jgi:enoyl-CoA hydratase/carnithine racemase
MILAGEPVETGDALRWGLVHEVAPAGQLDAAVESAVTRLLQSDPGRATFARRAMVEDIVVAGTRTR